jgi:hypothetical protein
MERKWRSKTQRSHLFQGFAHGNAKLTLALLQTQINVLKNAIP